MVKVLGLPEELFLLLEVPDIWGGGVQGGATPAESSFCSHVSMDLFFLEGTEDQGFPLVQLQEILFPLAVEVGHLALVGLTDRPSLLPLPLQQFFGLDLGRSSPGPTQTFVDAFCPTILSLHHALSLFGLERCSESGTNYICLLREGNPSPKAN